MHRIPHLLKLTSALCLALAGLVAAPAPPAQAVPTDRYVATTGSDTSNDCSNSGTPCQTVGNAILYSFAGDTIYIAAGSYVENLYIAIDLTLEGAGMDATILDGGDAGRVVAIPLGPTVSLSGMTLQNGDTGTNTGGGISSWGTLALDHVRVTGNTAGFGAGIESGGPLTITDSDISWNTATNSGSGIGGGLYLAGAVTTTLTRVSVRYNSAEAYSGGIQVHGGGTANLTNVTVQGNSTTSGSAAMSVSGGSTANFLNSTIAGNTGDNPLNNAVAGYAALNFKNTIVSANTPGNCFVGGGSTWTSQGNNIDSGNTCGFGAAGDQVNTDSMLEDAGDYGGSVFTMTLQAGSPAIDAGSNSGCPADDARGFPRPVDGDNNATATCDVGAVEMKQQTTTFGAYGLAPNPSYAGHAVTASATIVGSLTTPTGTVEVTGTGTSCNISLSSGSGSCGLTFSTPGPHGVLFRYTGDSSHDASQAALLHIGKPPPPADFDADGDTAVSVFRTGTWFIHGQGATGWGQAGDIPIAADYDGDGDSDFAVYRPSTGGWRVMNQFTLAHGGVAGDVPVPGDYDADGDADIAIYRSTTAGWYVKDQFTVGYGLTTDIPVPGDYNGDGLTDVAVFRDGVWFIKDQGVIGYGQVGDIPIPGDYNGDGTTDIAVYRPSTGGWRVRNQFIVAHGGLPGDIPVPGDYDADGDTDVAIFRSSTAGWYIKDQFTVGYGLSTDYPVPAPDTNGDGDPYQ